MLLLTAVGHSTESTFESNVSNANVGKELN